MKVERLSDFHRGWIIGDFQPSVLRTPDFEVGVMYHPKGEIWPAHTHQYLAWEAPPQTPNHNLGCSRVRPFMRLLAKLRPKFAAARDMILIIALLHPQRGCQFSLLGMVSTAIFGMGSATSDSQSQLRMLKSASFHEAAC